MANNKTKLIIGKFYMAYGGHQHPSLVFAYNDKHNTYLSLKFGTTPGKQLVEIHPIQEGITKSYVHKRPFEGTRKDYGSKELLGLYINEKDFEKLKLIQQREPMKSKRAKRRYINKKCR